MSDKYIVQLCELSLRSQMYICVFISATWCSVYSECFLVVIIFFVVCAPVQSTPTPSPPTTCSLPTPPHVHHPAVVIFLLWSTNSISLTRWLSVAVFVTIIPAGEEHFQGWQNIDQTTYHSLTLRLSVALLLLWFLQESSQLNALPTARGLTRQGVFAIIWYNFY